jgi:DNA-binding response OmpR family regulator
MNKSKLIRLVKVETYKVFVNHVEKYFTTKELKLLKFLVDNPNKVLDRKCLMLYVWENENLICRKTVDKYIENIRKKLGVYKKYIETVEGVGYKFITE